MSFSMMRAGHHVIKIQLGGSLTMGLLLLIVLVLFLVGGLPRWGYHSYGYTPSGLAAVLPVVLVILLLTGRL